MFVKWRWHRLTPFGRHLAGICSLSAAVVRSHRVDGVARRETIVNLGTITVEPKPRAYCELKLKGDRTGFVDIQQAVRFHQDAEKKMFYAVVKAERLALLKRLAEVVPNPVRTKR